MAVASAATKAIKTALLGGRDGREKVAQTVVAAEKEKSVYKKERERVRVNNLRKHLLEIKVVGLGEQKRTRRKDLLQNSCFSDVHHQ